MRMVNRGRVDIAAAILKAARNRAVKTQLMYGAQVSFKQLDDYLKFLIECEMIRYFSDKNQYETTETGVAFINSYDTMWDVLHRIRMQSKEKATVATRRA
jgi:predicted transcriptional regulator